MTCACHVAAALHQSVADCEVAPCCGDSQGGTWRAASAVHRDRPAAHPVAADAKVAVANLDGLLRRHHWILGMAVIHLQTCGHCGRLV